jgi:hypothetical protein
MTSFNEAKSDWALARAVPATVKAITTKFLDFLYASTLLSSANLNKLNESAILANNSSAKSMIFETAPASANYSTFEAIVAKALNNLLYPFLC